MRFTLSYRDVEDLLAERGLNMSYETVRRWVLKFGPLFARELRGRRPRPTSQWHLDEMAGDCHVNLAPTERESKGSALVQAAVAARQF
jgi:transposase-like protein